MKQQAKIAKKTVFVFKSIIEKTKFTTDPTKTLITTSMGTGIIQ